MTDKGTGVKELYVRKKATLQTVELSGRRTVCARDVLIRSMMIRNGTRMDLTCPKDGPSLCQK